MLLAIVFKKMNITHAIMAEAEILAHHQAFERKASAEVIHKGFGSHCRDLWCKLNNNTIRNVAIVFCQSEFFFQGCQIAHIDLWSHHHKDMWRESHHDWCALQGLCHSAQFVQEALVLLVNTIKITNSDSNRFVRS